MPSATRADLLIVGAGVAGARCARALRRRGFDGTIVLVGDEPTPPYNRPPLSKELLLLDAPPSEDLLLAEPASWYERRGVELRSGVAVRSIDPAARVASLDDGTEIGFGGCLLATGAAPRPLAVPGGERALLLRTLTDARALRAAADRLRGAPAVVVGGGFIGVEVASALARRGMRPTLVEMGGQLWGGQLGALLAGWAAERLAAAGVEVRLGVTVSRIDDRGAWVGDRHLAAEIIVAGVGVRPRDELARAAGLAASDGIDTDAAGRTSAGGVWAAGDVARVAGRRVEHWHAAREAGERVAGSILGEPTPVVPVPWVFSEVGGTPLDVIGDPAAADAERWIGDRVVVATADGRVVGLGVLGGAIRPDRGRELVARGASIEEVGSALR